MKVIALFARLFVEKNIFILHQFLQLEQRSLRRECFCVLGFIIFNLALALSENEESIYLYMERIFHGYSEKYNCRKLESRKSNKNGQLKHDY